MGVGAVDWPCPEILRKTLYLVRLMILTMTCGVFSEWAERYLSYLLMRNYSPRTLESYRRVIRRFAGYAWLRQTGVESPEKADLKSVTMDGDVSVSPALVTDFFSCITRHYAYKATTLQRYMSTLSSFYHYLVAQGAVSSNPMGLVERPRIKDKELRYLKHSQVIRLLRSVEDVRDRLIIRTIYATGVRVSELCGIDIGDIDFEEQTIRIRGKGGKIRTVFIDEETLAEIDEYIENRIEGPLFVGQQGHNISPRTVQFLFRKYAPAGITPHKIRHSYASELYRRSHNLRVVQENLGHASIKTTEIYLHTDLDERRRVYQEYFPLSGNGK